MDDLLKNGVARPEETSTGSNDGVILTSTLWSQSGTVYVSVDGKQTALTGYTYNKFAPCADGSKHSPTGCSNTADAQIIYYWIEKGYDFSLAVTTDDYFYVNSSSVKHSVSNYPTSGEGSMNEVNQALASKSRIGNGNFIAALCYFCGVNNHSTYKSGSTSTSWSYTVSHTGSGAAAFEAAGFDSYYFIARKASGSVPGVFFVEGASFTEAGFSVLRENLDYGEAIRVGIPGHAIYMDGYRTTNSGYEYHLNYGWGVNSDKTKWYTVDELKALEINYVTIDITPDLSVRVTSAAGDYRGGSFVRGIERINHVVNDKSTTFTFDDDLAGTTITLSSVASLTSNVDVAFQNIQCTLATTAAGLLSSGRGMSFEISGGAMIVNSTSAQYVIRETGNSAVNVTIDGGYIYSGYSSGGIAAVRSALALADYSFGKLTSSFRATVSGFAVKSGSAADCVTIGAASAIVGGLSLGAGNNTLDIGSGSLFYGSFAGAANTLTVNLTIDDVGCSGATAALADAASEQAFYQATGGVLNLTFDAFADGAHTYELYRGVDAATAESFAVNLKTNGKTVKLDSTHREYACCELVYDGANISLVCDMVMPEVTSVKADITAPTAKNVTVSATFSANSKTRQYSLDNLTWKNYTGGVVMNSNGTVYFRGLDEMGNSSALASYQVTNIDRTPPAKPVAQADINTTTNKDVTVTAAFSADSAVREYSFDNMTWQTYTSGVVFKKNGTAYFRGVDAAGNVSGVAIYNVTNIDKSAPGKPAVTADITTPTNKSVTVKATFATGSVSKEYSLDNAQWRTYTSGVVLSANGTVYFRSNNKAGNWSEVASYTVSNIDKVAPAKPTVVPDITAATGKNVTVTATYSSDTALRQYSLDNKTWNVYSSGIVMTANGNVYFRGVDAAGNVSEVAKYKVSNIDRTPPSKPLAKASTTAPTNKSVTVTASFSLDSAVKQYSLDNKTWKSYSGGVTLSKNGTVYFRAADAAGNWSEVASCTVFNILTTTDLSASGAVAPGQDASFTPKLAAAGLYTVSGSMGSAKGAVTITDKTGKKVGSGAVKGGVVTFKKALLLDNGNSYTVVIKNTDKTSGDAAFSVKLKAEELFTKGDNDTQAKAKTLAAGKTTNDWVGYGDAVDWYKLGVNSQGGFYDLSISGVRNPVKLTIYAADGRKVKTVAASAKKPNIALADLCLANGSYAVIEAPKAAKAQNSDYTLKLTQKAVFTGAKNNDWKNAQVLKKGATFSGTLTKAPGGDVVDYCDVSKIDTLYFDMTAGKAKVSFYDAQHNAVKAAVKLANGAEKFAASLTLAANNAATDHFTIAAIDAAVKYLKIEASGKTLNGYSITKIA